MDLDFVAFGRVFFVPDAIQSIGQPKVVELATPR